MISCSEAVRQLWAYLEDQEEQVDADDRGRVEEHLALCRRCCGEAEFTTALRDLLRSTEAPALPADVEGHLTAFLDGLGKEPA